MAGISAGPGPKDSKGHFKLCAKYVDGEFSAVTQVVSLNINEVSTAATGGIVVDVDIGTNAVVAAMVSLLVCPGVFTEDDKERTARCGSLQSYMKGTT